MFLQLFFVVCRVDEQTRGIITSTYLLTYLSSGSVLWGVNFMAVLLSK